MGVCIVVVLLLGCFFIFTSISNNKSNKKDIVVKEDTTPKKKKKNKEDNSLYKVDIKGEIITPGIYTLKSGSRVIDVINSAGGLTDKADTSVINLSKKITDEMVIIIYSKQEVRNFERTKEIEKTKLSSCIQKDENALKNDACIDIDSSKTTGKISINKATKEEFMTLSGIGESKADAIIKYREENGPFQTIEDIKKVSGIGDSLFDKIKENITT